MRLGPTLVCVSVHGSRAVHTHFTPGCFVAAEPCRTPSPRWSPSPPSACARLQRDDAINAGFAWFREKGLIPANDDDSDDDVNYAEAAGVEW